MVTKIIRKNIIVLRRGDERDQRTWNRSFITQTWICDTVTWAQVL